MQKIGDITNTADSHGEFTNGNVAAGIPPTLLEAEWFNTVQREIINVLLKAGMQPNKTNDAQLSEAIGQLVNQVNDNANSRLEKAKNGADIPNKPKFVSNIGAYPKTGGTIEGKVFTTSDMDVAGWIGGAKLYERYNDGEWAQVYSEAHKPKPEEIGVYSTKEVDDRFAYKISQDTFTCGNLHVNATHDWAGVVFKKPSGYSTTLAANPDNSESMLTIRYRDKKDNTLNYVDFLKKTGTVALTSQLLGVGQRWIDSTSIRHNDARYTNNTDKPIVVYVESEMTNKRTGPYSMGGEVDGLRVGYFWVSTVGIHSISFIVPPGSSYIVKAGWGVSLTPDAITRWIELR